MMCLVCCLTHCYLMIVYLNFILKHFILKRLTGSNVYIMLALA